MADYRRKAADGTITLEEMREAVQLMRQGRISAIATAGSTKRTSTKAPVKSADQLLSELENL
jgi:4-hydroxy-L-threonine phosphate dehydrogenase PdxA